MRRANQRENNGSVRPGLRGVSTGQSRNDILQRVDLLDKGLELLSRQELAPRKNLVIQPAHPRQRLTGLSPLSSTGNARGPLTTRKCLRPQGITATPR